MLLSILAVSKVITGKYNSRNEYTNINNIDHTDEDVKKSIAISVEYQYLLNTIRVKQLNNAIKVSNYGLILILSALLLKINTINIFIIKIISYIKNIC